MKKLICALAAAMIAVLCGAAALEVNGDFKILDRNGKPKNWERNGWSGYQPFAKFEILEENGARVLHIFDAAARGGFGWFYSARIDARAGGRFLITARVKGSGSGSFGLQLRDTGDKHIGQTERGGGFKLTEEWRDIAVTLDVVNSDRGETAKVLLTFTGTKGSELYISNITVAPEKSDTVGNAVFPREWTVFAPVAENTEVPTDRIPEKIGEISGRRVLLEGSRNMLDFRPFFPERKHRNCAWSFAVINVKNAEDYTVGAGADYYFALYVNGAKVLDTLEKGNAVGEPHFNNYLATVRLRPGENILAVKFLSGSGVFPRLCIGGANELRGMATALGISEYWEQDDYENACPRPGNPKLIREIVSPGWLTVSGQGVYSSGKFQLGKREYSLPLPASGKLFATGIRIQGLNGPAASACLSAGPLAAELATQNGVFEVRLIDGGKILRTLSLPRNALPADFILAGGRSHAYLNVASLADGKMRSLDAPVTHTGEEKFSVMLECSGDGTELTVDNYFTALAAPETKSNDVPFKIALDETFDPVKAGWPLVWHDEFDGDKVDLEKRWFMPIWLAKRDRVDYLTIQDGILHIRCELKSGEARPQTSGIRSRDTFQYGYFEARVRFTRQPGWWAAFWLVEEGKSMPTAGGSEIDIFEDYTTRRADRMIANNFHAFMGNVTKSYGYTFTLPDSFDDFYVIGCKWTPFEISTYLNGRLIRSTAAHSPWQSLTFDAINHAFPTSPSRVIVSGQVGSSGGKATGPFVEEYLVDYVRIYAYPKTHLPEISWKVVPDKNIVSTGTMLKFSADVRSNRDTQSSIAGVYLFDNGFLMDYKTSAPYEFILPLTQEHYRQTCWGTPGRSSVTPQLDGFPHFYQIAVQDAAGQVSSTEAFPLINIDLESRPYQGILAAIPGSVKAGDFDDGGQNSAFHKVRKPKESFSRKVFTLFFDGEWVRYTVNVEKNSLYTAILHRLPVRDRTQGDNYYPAMRLAMFVNDRLAGYFQCRPGEKTTVLKNIELVAGPAKLTVMPLGGSGVSFEKIDFILEQ